MPTVFNGFPTGGGGGGESGGGQDLLKLETTAQISAASQTAAIPTTPAQGDVIIAPAGDVNAGSVGVFDNGTWTWYPPMAGWIAFVRDEGVFYRFDGTAWVLLGSGLGAVTTPALTTTHDPLTIRGPSGTTSSIAVLDFTDKDGVGLAQVRAPASRSSVNFTKFATNGWSVESMLRLYSDEVDIFGIGLDPPSGYSVITRDRGDRRYGIERGANANGEYTRFADGTQLCFGTLSFSIGSNQASGAVFVSDELYWTYPATFVTAPESVSGGVLAASSQWVNARPTSTTQALVRIFGTVSNGSSRSVRVLAIGRWF